MVCVWSGQGPDPEDWWKSIWFWRWASWPLLVAGMGAVAVGTQSFQIPSTSVSLSGAPAVLAGIGTFVFGSLAFGLMVAYAKRYE